MTVTQSDHWTECLELDCVTCTYQQLIVAHVRPPAPVLTSGPKDRGKRHLPKSPSFSKVHIREWPETTLGIHCGRITWYSALFGFAKHLHQISEITPDMNINKVSGGKCPSRRSFPRKESYNVSCIEKKQELVQNITPGTSNPTTTHGDLVLIINSWWNPFGGYGTAIVLDHLSS